MRTKKQQDPLDILSEWAKKTPGVPQETCNQIEDEVYNVREAGIPTSDTKRRKVKVREVSRQQREEAQSRAFKTLSDFYDSLIVPTRDRLVPLIRALLLRNREFLAAFNHAMQEKSPELKRERVQELGKEWKVLFYTARLYQGELPRFMIRPGVASIRLFDPRDKTAREKLDEGISKRAAATTPETRAAAFSRDFSLPTDCTPGWIAEGLLGAKDKSGHYASAGHTLLLSIDLRRPFEEIKEQVQQIIQQHKEITDNRDCFGKWWQYILVYDLHAVLGSYEKCADFFGQAFPSDNTFQNLRNTYEQDGRGKENKRENIRRYCNSAKELISGGYRKYLI